MFIVSRRPPVTETNNCTMQIKKLASRSCMTTTCQYTVWLTSSLESESDANIGGSEMQSVRMCVSGLRCTKEGMNYLL